nr:hypothetical protein [Morganella morganii]
MKIRTAIMYALLSLCLAVYGLIKTAWRAEPDVQQSQRQQQRRELRQYLQSDTPPSAPQQRGTAMGHAPGQHLLAVV